MSDIKFDEKLNDAGWRMINLLQSQGSLNGHQFNSMKLYLREVISDYNKEKDQQLAAAKAEIAELHRCLDYAHEWLGIDSDYKGSPLCNNISDALAKHKGE